MSECNRPPQRVTIKHTHCNDGGEICSLPVSTVFNSSRDKVAACVNGVASLITIPELTGINLKGLGAITVSEGDDGYSIGLNCGTNADPLEAGDKVLTCGTSGPVMKTIDKCALGIEETTYETFQESVKTADGDEVIDSFRIESDCPNATGLLILTGVLGVSAPL